MVGSARKGNEVGEDGDDKLSVENGTDRSWSVTSQLFKTWQHFPEEHVGALQ